jgi:serine/threonine protein kinase
LRDYFRQLKNKRLTAGLKFQIIYQIVRGYQQMHESGIAHLDISQINVMLNSVDTADIEVRLIDFGKARLVKASEASKFLPTPLSKEECRLLPRMRMAPDHGQALYRCVPLARNLVTSSLKLMSLLSRSPALLPRNRVDHAIRSVPTDLLKEDVYSLGILLWTIMSGRSAWNGILDTELDALRRIITNKCMVEQTITRDFEGSYCRRLLSGCLRYEPPPWPKDDDDPDWDCAKTRWDINQVASFLFLNRDAFVQEFEAARVRCKGSTSV